MVILKSCCSKLKYHDIDHLKVALREELNFIVKDIALDRSISTAAVKSSK